VLAGNAAETGIPVASLAYLKLKISERFRKAKEGWHASPAHHGTEETPPPPPKKSCLDHMRNSLARTALEVSGIPQEDSQASVLVLQRRG
jgi:hypothetical protein